MAVRKKKRPELFGIWLDGRRLGGAFVLDEALALLGACARRLGGRARAISEGSGEATASADCDRCSGNRRRG